MGENLAGGYVNLTKFWGHVQKTERCWIWTGRTTGGTSTKYGLFYVGVQSIRGAAGRLEGVHRISYELASGPIPSGLQVRHSCNQGMCVRPDHLLVGTALENAADKVAAGNQTKGEAVNTAKLSADQVRQIRETYATGVVSLPMLARQFRIGRKAIQRLVHGESWGHLQGGVLPRYWRRGRYSPMGKLTVTQVREIRKSKKRVRELMSDYKVSEATICSIRTRRTWKNI